MKKQKKSVSQVKPMDLNKLTIHDLIANLVQFVHYTDEFLKVTKYGQNKTNLDISVLQNKAKDILQMMDDNFYKTKL